MCIYIYIYEGLRPLPPAPFLRLIACWLGGFLDCCVCCAVLACCACFVCLLAVLAYYSCLLCLLAVLACCACLAAGGGLGRHVGGPWRCQGLGLGPGLARGRQNGLDCAPVRAGALFYWDPRTQVTTKVGGGFDASGTYCILFNIRQSAIRLGK